MVLDGATRNKPLGPRVEQNDLPIEGWDAEEFGYHEFKHNALWTGSPLLNEASNLVTAQCNRGQRRGAFVFSRLTKLHVKCVFLWS